MNLIVYIKNNKYLVTLIFVGIFFIFIYSWLYQGSNGKFSSPDETANFYFSSLFTNETQLKYEQPFYDITNLVKPRSTSVINGYVVPGSFVGLPMVYGLIGKIFGKGIILFLTPFFAVVGVIYFYLLIKRIFNKSIAFSSCLVLFFIPPYFLYAARGMFHNVFFVDMVIISLYFLILLLEKNKKYKKDIKKIYSLLSGIFLSVALLTRTSEIIWLVLVYLIIYLVYRKKIKQKYLVIWAIPLILSLILFLVVNQQVYGDVFNFSKSNIITNSGQSNETELSHQNLLSKMWGYFLPFGFNEEILIFSLKNYILLIFPWFSLLLFIGLFYVVKNLLIRFLSYFIKGIYQLEQKIDKKLSLYSYIYFIVFIWLIFYYGSYALNEYIDNQELILGSSYLRYWLPLYVFGLPLVFYGLNKILSILKNKYFRQLIIFTALIAICLTSFVYVLTDSLHGLIITRDYNVASNNLSTTLRSHISANSIIISGDADKIFFPEMNVIYKLTGDKREKSNIINALLKQTDIYYYYNPLDVDSVDTLSQLKNMHIIFEKIENLSYEPKIMYQLR